MNDGMMYILIIVIIIIFVFFLVIEVVFVIYYYFCMKNLVENGNKRVKLVIKLNSNYDVFLLMILIGNNIVNILGVFFVILLFVKLFGNDLGVILLIFVFIIIILIFGEVILKSIVKEYLNKFVMFVVLIVNVFVFVLFLVNFFFKVWKKVLFYIVKLNSKVYLSEDEFIMIVDEV